MSSSQFMAALSAATRAALPKGFRPLRSAHRSWLCQLYPRDPRLHYEVWNMGQWRNKIELGLHFESRDHALNRKLLAGFDRRMVEIKATLGPQWEAEMWDKGWAKVYEVLPYERFSTDTLAATARRLARAITVLQPLWDDVTESAAARRAGQ
ncbi:MAG: hypothetical protein IT317_18625 [Anaerolineales bacterium]|nr:hypothetical protein [Anaerolineales bacterium]